MEKVKTNADAYNYIKRQCLNGYRQNIQRGSFENESIYRMQSYPIAIEITEPMNFLYLPKEVSLGMIEKYYNDYIIGDVIADNETYTYGSRINIQLYEVFDMLKNTPNTNQAAISISEPNDIFLHDPPCLRHIQFGFFNDKLNLTTYWRSNDIGEGFLTNQGGMSLLLRDAAEYSGLDIGSHFYMSSGAHIYKY